jgi:uncharacterized PurR-regulated membrane protein YhhQ (DUF165 family)
MAEHWVEIATFDYMVKLAANMIIFVPVYGVALKYIIRKITAA